MSYYRNPTANAAIGAADREFQQARKLAARLRRLREQGRLTRQELREAWRACPRACWYILRRALKP